MIDIQPTRYCESDELEVRGGSEGGPLLATYCGYNRTVQALTFNGPLYVRFKSDSTIAGRGFSAQVKVNRECGETVEVDSINGGTYQLQSPNYPRNYPHQSHCQWNYLLPSPADNISLKVEFPDPLNIEAGSHLCRFDVLEIRKVSLNTSLARFCGENQIIQPLDVNHSLQITFTSDSSVSKKGFKATVTVLRSGEPIGQRVIGVNSSEFLNEPAFPRGPPPAFSPGRPASPRIPGSGGRSCGVNQPAATSTCKGDPGRDGTTGRDGTPGTPGKDGVPGRNGVPGAIGEPGPKGVPGSPGPRGPKGIPGVPGQDGFQNLPGENSRGPPGAKGEPGQPGMHGAPGQRGPKGEHGPPGRPGAPGAPSPHSPTTSQVQDVTYVRWGRHGCDIGRPFYDGFAVGVADASVQPISCLPFPLQLNPSSNKTVKSSRENTVTLTTAKFNLQGISDALNPQLHNRPIQCALCHARRSEVFTVIGWSGCHAREWQRAYSGYLMSSWRSGDPSSTPSQTICIDKRPEVVDGFGGDKFSPQISYVQSGSGLWIRDRILPCTVCIKDL